MENINSKFEQALYLSEKLGWSIIPVSINKQPLVEWKKYQEIKPTREELVKWFEEYSDANIGVVTGRISNIVVVDIDPRHGGSTKEFSRIITVKTKTGGNGEHFYFLYEGGIQNHAGIRPGIDIRGEGGFVVVPPSIHASGKQYEWLMSPHANTPIIPLPLFVKEWIKNLRSNSEGRWNPELLKGVEEGRRNESAASVIGKLLAHYPKSDWEDAWELILGWNMRNKPPMDLSELRTTFNSVASRELINNPLIQEPIITIPNATDFLNQDFGDVDWIIKDLIPTGGSALLIAKRESYKTWLAIYMAHCIAKGIPLWERFETNKSKVLYVANDDPTLFFQKRLDRFQFDDSFFIYHQNLPPFTIEEKNESFTSVKKLIKEANIGVLFIDILRNTHNRDSNTDKDSKAVFDRYKELRANNSDLVFIFLIHPSKENLYEKRFSKRQAEEAVGSYYWEAGVDTVLSLTKTTDDQLTDKVLITVTKNKQSNKRFKPFIGISRNFDGPVEFTYEEKVPDTLKVEKAKEAILLVLQQVPLKRQEIIGQLITENICSERTTEAALAQLTEDQKVTHTKTKPHVYSLASSENISQTAITNKDYGITESFVDATQKKKLV